MTPGLDSGDAGLAESSCIAQSTNSADTRAAVLANRSGAETELPAHRTVHAILAVPESEAVD